MKRNYIKRAFLHVFWCAFSTHDFFGGDHSFGLHFCTPAVGWGALPIVSGSGSAGGLREGFCGGSAGGSARGLRGAVRGP